MTSKFLTLTNYGAEPIKGMGNQDGLFPLKLDYWLKKVDGGKVSYHHLHRSIVNSGAPYAQIFRERRNEVAQRLEPIPEGVYTPGPIEFASGKWKDYSVKFGDIDSPVWQVIHVPRAIGFHLDGNRSYAPGSAGCPVFRTVRDMQIHVEISGEPSAFTSVWVDWFGLGKVTLPSGLKVPK